MKKIRNSLFPYYRFESFEKESRLLHFVSSAAYDLGFPEEGKKVDTFGNRCRLAEAVGIRPEQFVFAQQIHSCRVAIVGDKEAGRGVRERESRLPETDGMITDCRQMCLVVMAADCVPVLLFDREKLVIGAVHAGWRGTIGGIAAVAVQQMQESFGCRGENIIAGIGPSIGKCCFEVGGEVAERFYLKFGPSGEVVGKAETSGKYRIDLWEANRLDLLEAGLKAENIEVAGLCTFCHPEEFFSYRHSGKAVGRFGAGIMMR